MLKNYVENTLKILHQHPNHKSHDYVVPLNINISKAKDVFFKYYNEKKKTFLNSFPMNEEALSILPEELHPWIELNQIWIGYFHSKRKTGAYIPIHVDNHRSNVKYPCSINIPLIGCSENITTSFWEPVGEVRGLEKPKAEWYDYGQLNHAFEFALTDTAVLYNNQKWHSVFNPMPQDHERAIMIFKFSNEVPQWEDCRQLTHALHKV